VNDLERFIACMEFEAADRRPNHELGVWAQTRLRWMQEAPDAVRSFCWNWFEGEPALGLDRRDYIPVNFGFIPPFTREVIEQNDEIEVYRDEKGILHRALRTGAVGNARMCMDQYIEFPVRNREDFRRIRQRLIAADARRYPPDLDQRIAAWRKRTCPLVLGRNCAANGFYWRAREWMGTEALSYAWYDQPALVDEMMEFYADFIMETSRPVLEKIEVEYFTFNEDMAMKTGPLLSPKIFRRFIFPHLKRMVAFFREHGVRYVAVDTDGDPTPLVPLLIEAGIDTLWPLERAANVDPVEYRRRFGRSLRLWGGVDKRVLNRGPAAIRAHLREFIPLIEEGGFIPTVDHTVPPDVSWDDFRYYMDAKMELLRGNFAALE